MLSRVLWMHLSKFGKRHAVVPVDFRVPVDFFFAVFAASPSASPSAAITESLLAAVTTASAANPRSSGSGSIYMVYFLPVAFAPAQLQRASCARRQPRISKACGMSHRASSLAADEWGSVLKCGRLRPGPYTPPPAAISP